MQTVEQEIQAKGLTAPRITPEDIQNAIAGEYYFRASDGVEFASPDSVRDVVQWQAMRCLTFCVLVLTNGFTCTGESACASPENYDESIGRRIAKANAVAKIWPLLGYQLKTALANG